MPTRARCLACALLLLALPLAAQAARLALVIGNDSYASVAPLKNARNDARLMAGLLREAKYDVTLVENANSRQLWGAVSGFARRVGRDDEVVFYFSGHGVQIGANQVLLPIDTEGSDEVLVEQTGLPLYRVRELLRPARVSLLVIDACRDNPFPKQGTRSVGETRGLQPPPRVEGQAVIMAAGFGQKALDYVPQGPAANGLFTYEFVRVARTPNLNLRQALAQVRDRVDDAARRAGNPQRPEVSEDMRGDFYIFVAPGAGVTVAAPPQAPPAPRPAVSAEQIEDQAWEDAARADNLATYEAFVAEFPRGRHTGRARVRIAALKVAGAGAAPAAAAATVEDSIHAQLDAAQARYDSAAAAAAATTSPLRRGRECVSGVCFEWVVVPAGRFTMGSDEGDADERPAREVSLRPFAIGTTEVTQALWQAVMGENPSAADRCADCPVARVSWDDAQAFVGRLAQATGKAYRLPSEAEWEYACRAGERHAFCGGDETDAVAWSAENSGWRSHPVATRQPNAWGLYDMSGNVWEWTFDCWSDSYRGAPTDGSARHDGDCARRVNRGGGWRYDPVLARAGYRGWFAASQRDAALGLRVVATVD